MPRVSRVPFEQITPDLRAAMREYEKELGGRNSPGCSRTRRRCSGRLFTSISLSSPKREGRLIGN